MAKTSLKKLLIAVYHSEHNLLKAAKLLKDQGVKILDVFAPFPIHGIDELIGIPRSRLPRFTFLFGAMGLFASFVLQWGVNMVAWPMNIGGKPDNAWPAFIPVSFELTVLFGGVLSVVAFLAKSQLFPGKVTKLSLPVATNDGFVVALDMAQSGFNMEKTIKLLQDTGAMEIRESEG